MIYEITHERRKSENNQPWIKYRKSVDLNNQFQQSESGHINNS